MGEAEIIGCGLESASMTCRLALEPEVSIDSPCGKLDSRVTGSSSVDTETVVVF